MTPKPFRFAGVLLAVASVAAHAQEPTRASQESACESGAAAACTRLGDWYRLGDAATGSVADPRRATDQYERACQLGDPAGCSAAGRMYEGTDDGYSPGGTIPRYLVAAMHYHHTACQQGAAASCGAFDRLVDVDRREAECEAGDVAACKEVGDLSFGMVPLHDALDYDRAARAYLRACDAGAPDSCATLGVLYQGGGPNAGPAQERFIDYAKARHFYRLACDGGEAGSCVSLDSVALLEAAIADCDAGGAVGCRELAWRAQIGQEMPRNPAKAATLAGLACNRGDAQACVLSGMHFEEGIGVAPDRAQAQDRYRRARDLAPDDPKVRRMLEQRGAL